MTPDKATEGTVFGLFGGRSRLGAIKYVIIAAITAALALVSFYEEILSIMVSRKLLSGTETAGDAGSSIASEQAEHQAASEPDNSDSEALDEGLEKEEHLHQTPVDSLTDLVEPEGATPQLKDERMTLTPGGTRPDLDVRGAEGQFAAIEDTPQHAQQPIGPSLSGAWIVNLGDFTVEGCLGETLHDSHRRFSSQYGEPTVVWDLTPNASSKTGLTYKLEYENIEEFGGLAILGEIGEQTFVATAYPAFPGPPPYEVKFKKLKGVCGTEAPRP